MLELQNEGVYCQNIGITSEQWTKKPAVVSNLHKFND